MHLCCLLDVSALLVLWNFDKSITLKRIILSNQFISIYRKEIYPYIKSVFKTLFTNSKAIISLEGIKKSRVLKTGFAKNCRITALALVFEIIY